MANLKIIIGSSAPSFFSLLPFNGKEEVLLVRGEGPFLQGVLFRVRLEAPTETRVLDSAAVSMSGFVWLL